MVLISELQFPIGGNEGSTPGGFFSFLATNNAMVKSPALFESLEGIEI